MVPGDVQERDVQKCHDIFEVGVGQVSTPDDQFNIAEVVTVAKAVESFNDFVT